VPHIQRHDFLAEVFPLNSSKVLWLFADHTFPLFCSMLELPEYTEWLILGLSASIGQLTESLIKHSSAAFFQYLRDHLSDVPRIGVAIVAVFRRNLLNERVTYPMLNFLDTTLSSGVLGCLLDDAESDFADEIFGLVNAEVKGHKKFYKLVSGINVYCHLIQVPRLCMKVFSKMGIFLGLNHVHVRKSTALKLYEALVVHGDSIDRMTEESLDEVLELLSETDWGQPLPEIRPIRNKVCDLLGVKAPVSAAGAGATSGQ
jgi:tubulin-specific chaperone D